MMSMQETQSVNMYPNEMQIQELIRPFQEKIKKLEDEIKEKDLEIAQLKGKLYQNRKPNNNNQQFMNNNMNQMNMMNNNMNQMNMMNNNMKQMNMMNNNMNQMNNSLNQINNNMNQINNPMNQMKNIGNQIGINMMNNNMNMMNNQNQNNMMNIPMNQMNNNIMNNPMFQMCNQINLMENQISNMQILNRDNPKIIKFLSLTVKMEDGNQIMLQSKSDDKMKEVITKICCKAAFQMDDYNFNIIKEREPKLDSTIEENEFNEKRIIFSLKKRQKSTN